MNVSTVLIILTVFTAPSACMDCDIHAGTNEEQILSDFITCACQGVDTLFMVRNVCTSFNIQHVKCYGTRHLFKKAIQITLKKAAKSSIKLRVRVLQLNSYCC